MILALDTETALIRPGLVAPPLTCVAWAVGSCAEPGLEDHRFGPLVLLSKVRQGATIVGHNVAYDMAVIAAEAPAALPDIFQMYADDKITDTMLRQKLIDIARGEHKGVKDAISGQWTEHRYSLAALAKRHLALELEKGTHQLKFGELRGVPIEQWPEGRAEYAKEDVRATIGVYETQEARKYMLADQYRQARAAWATHLMSAWGIHTSGPAIDAFERNVTARYEEAVQRCKDAGLMRENGTRDTKEARRYMLEVCNTLDIKPKRTKGFTDLRRKRDDGEELTKRNLKDLEDPLHGICMDEEACLEVGDALLQAYSEVSSLMTVVKSHIPALRNGIHIPIQATFDSLVATGRMACKGHSEDRPTNGYQLHNVSRLPGIRECFVPRPGKLLLSCDYDGLELRTFAQVCKWVTGFSRQADLLNQGMDLHSDLGAQLVGCPYEEFLERRKEGDKEVKDARQFSKIGNFGFQGGMQPTTFRLYARQPGNGGIKKTLEECEELHRQWHVSKPEARPYFKWIKSLVGRANSATVQHFGSERYRGMIPFTVTANTFFQGLGADATKDAFFHISWECYVDKGTALYGCRLVNYVHDEFILEVPDHLLTARSAAARLEEVMIERAGQWLPDVPPTATACLSHCWSKNAEPAYNDNGELVPWTL